MKPRGYGYMRVGEEQSDEDVLAAEQELRDFAEAEGLALAGLFQDDESGRRQGFDALIGALKRDDATFVLVPNPDHLSPVGVLRDQFTLRLEHETDAVLLMVGDRSRNGVTT